MLVCVGALGLGVFFLRDTVGTADTSSNGVARTVSVASVGVLSEETAPLVVVGEVHSQGEAELRAEKSGRITRTYTTAGAFVRAGALLAEIEHDAESASALQAKGTLDAAEAALAKARAGARPEDKDIASSQTQGAENSLAEARNAAVNSYRSAFTLAQDAILAKTDTLFTNAQTVRPNFIPISPTYTESTALEQERIVIGEELLRWQGETARISSSSDLPRALDDARATLERIKTFLDRIGYFVGMQSIGADVTATSIATQNATVLAARSAIDGALSGVTGARSGLAAAENASRVASLSYTKTLAGDRPEDIAALEASVVSARGAYLGAVARLETGLIRAPISGTVSTFGARVGSYTTSGELLAVITSASGIEVEALISESAMHEFPAGTRARIEGNIEGVVTSIESGLDPDTKKARIHIALPDDTALVPGQFVEVALVRDTTLHSASVIEAAPADMRIPLTAIKVLPGGLFVFTVDTGGVLVAHPITEGPIVGDRMRITEGVMPDMRIVIDARGLNAGDTVLVTHEQ